MKRRRDENETDNLDGVVANKRQKTENKMWVSGTAIRNYMRDDTLVDYLQLNKEKTFDNLQDYLLNKGVEFEKMVVEYINENLCPVLSISETFSEDGVQETKRLMKRGVPIIHSAPVSHSEFNFGGIIDLLIRSDVIEKLFANVSGVQKQKAPKLNGNYHYIVIDVKYSTLKLRSDGIHLINEANARAYKGQLWIYTKCIEEIQGYDPEVAYLLGRGYNYRSKDIPYKGTSCFERLGCVDFKKMDKEFIEKTKDAITWVRDLRKNGNEWTIFPPSRQELYPNMCIDSGKYYDKKKREIAEELGEISLLWNCGLRNRKIAIDNGFSSWKKSEFDVKKCGISEKKIGNINKIVKVNTNNTYKFLPKKIEYNIFDWKTPDNEVYVDFETITTLIDDFEHFPEKNKSEMIFMIGVWFNNEGSWEYKNFTCSELTIDEEFKIMNDFVNFMDELDEPKIYYWCAENIIWKKASDKQYDIADDSNNKERKNIILNFWGELNWCDLHILFKEEQIAIKGCYGYGLKEIASAMREHNMIECHIESECDNGMMAVINAWNAYKDKDFSVLDDIAIYNKFDVKVLWEIVEYLRKNHC